MVFFPCQFLRPSLASWNEENLHGRTLRKTSDPSTPSLSWRVRRRALNLECSACEHRRIPQALTAPLAHHQVCTASWCAGQQGSLHTGCWPVSPSVMAFPASQPLSLPPSSPLLLTDGLELSWGLQQNSACLLPLQSLNPAAEPAGMFQYRAETPSQGVQHQTMCSSG